MLRSLVLFLSLTSSFAFSSVSFAEEIENRNAFPNPKSVENTAEAKPHVGLLLGMSNPEGRYSSGTEYGLDVGFQPYIPLSAGFEVTHNENKTKEEFGENLRQTNLLAKAAYNFGGTNIFIRYAHIGALADASFRNNETLLTSGPMLGFDIPVNLGSDSKTSLGLSIRYLINEGSNADILSTNAALKIWL
ncbi:MAG: hypothetical protein ACOYOK_12245 [Pseudobdellovibrionaceae bacterium]